MRGTRLTVEPNGNNVKDWAIRSQAPKLVMVKSIGEGSETKRLRVVNDGLTNLIWHKI